MLIVIIVTNVAPAAAPTVLREILRHTVCLTTRNQRYKQNRMRVPNYAMLLCAVIYMPVTLLSFARRDSSEVDRDARRSVCYRSISRSTIVTITTIITATIDPCNKLIVVISQFVNSWRSWTQNDRYLSKKILYAI